jgi:hypothetical protein
MLVIDDLIKSVIAHNKLGSSEVANTPDESQQLVFARGFG